MIEMNIRDWLTERLNPHPVRDQESRDKTQALVDEACEVVDRVNTARVALNEKLHQSERDEIANVLLAARDRRND